MPSSLRRFAGRQFWREAARAQQTVLAGARLRRPAVRQQIHNATQRGRTQARHDDTAIFASELAPLHTRVALGCNALWHRHFCWRQAWPRSTAFGPRGRVNASLSRCAVAQREPLPCCVAGLGSSLEQDQRLRVRPKDCRSAKRGAHAPNLVRYSLLRLDRQRIGADGRFSVGGGSIVTWSCRPRSGAGIHTDNSGDRNGTCGAANWPSGTLAIAPIAGAELFLARAIGSGRNDAVNRCSLARSSSGARPQFARYGVEWGHRCGAADGKEPNRGALF